jgi:hypothetical protein
MYYVFQQSVLWHELELPLKQQVLKNLKLIPARFCGARYLIFIYMIQVGSWLQ